MSSDMFVDVPAVCSRTKKTYSISMPLSEVTDYVAAQEAKKKVSASLAETLQAAEAAPDLVVYWKGQVHVLTNIHENSHPAVSRYVNQILKEDIYEVPPQRTRSKGGAAEDGEDGESADAPATGSKKRGRPKKAAEASEALDPAVEIEEG